MDVTTDVAPNDVVADGQEAATDSGPALDGGSWCSHIDGATWCEDFDESNTLPADLAPAVTADAMPPFVAASDPASPPNSLFASAPGTSVVDTYVASGAFPTPTTNLVLDYDMKCTHVGAVANAGPVIYFLPTGTTTSISLQFESGMLTAVLAVLSADGGLTTASGTTGTFNCDTAFHHFSIQIVKGITSTITVTADGLVMSQISTSQLELGKLYVDIGVGVTTSAMTMNIDNVVLRSN